MSVIDRTDQTSIKKTVIDHAHLIEEIRMLSIVTGKIYPFQIENLKSIPLVIFGEKSKVVLSLDCDNLKASYDIMGNVDYDIKKEKESCLYLSDVVKAFLGKYNTNISICGKEVMKDNKYVRKTDPVKLNRKSKKVPNRK